MLLDLIFGVHPKFTYFQGRLSQQGRSLIGFFISWKILCKFDFYGREWFWTAHISRNIEDMAPSYISPFLPFFIFMPECNSDTMGIDEDDYNNFLIECWLIWKATGLFPITITITEP
jgi:hypothetical protein